MIICPSADDFEKSLGTVSHPMFLGIIAIASALFAATVYFGIIRHVTRRKGWRIFWGIMVSLLASSFIWAMRGRRFIQPDSGSYDLVTVGFYVMMVAVVMMLLILLRDLAMWIWKGVKAWQNRRGRKLTPKNESYVQPSELQEEKSSEKVAKFLKKNSLHKRDFAEMIGVTLSYVYNLIDETVQFSTRGTTIERIATVMEVSPEVFQEYRIPQEPILVDENLDK